MDVLTSTEFRKRYGSLLRPTVVTVNGHAIGVWQPHKGPHEDEWRIALGVEPVPAPVARALTQAQRDAILRKVNRTDRK